jgi:hypothetical protein
VRPGASGRSPGARMLVAERARLQEPHKAAATRRREQRADEGTKPFSMCSSKAERKPLCEAQSSRSGACGSQGERQARTLRSHSGFGFGFVFGFAYCYRGFITSQIARARLVRFSISAQRKSRCCTVLHTWRGASALEGTTQSSSDAPVRTACTRRLRAFLKTRQLRRTKHGAVRSFGATRRRD